jgi:hypothetical protein
MFPLFPLGANCGHAQSASCTRESAADAYALPGPSCNRGLGRTNLGLANSPLVHTKLSAYLFTFMSETLILRASIARVIRSFCSGAILEPRYTCVTQLIFR